MRRFLLFPLTRIVLAAGVIFLPFIALQLALDASGRNLPGWGDAALITALSVLALWILARFIEGRALSEVGLARTGAVWQTLLGFGVGAPLLNTRLDGPALWTGVCPAVPHWLTCRSWTKVPPRPGAPSQGRRGADPPRLRARPSSSACGR